MRAWRKACLLLLLWACVPRGPAAHAQDAPAPGPRAAPAPAFLSPAASREAVPAVTPAGLERSSAYSEGVGGRAVLVMQHGEVLFERYAGGWEGNLPHPLASGTKSLSGLMAAAAVTDGLLRLDEPVADTLVEWKARPEAAPMTVRMLLDLSSGLEPESELFGPRGYGVQGLGPVGGAAAGADEAGAGRLRRALAPPAPRDWFGDVLSVPVTREPGRVFRYGAAHFHAWGALLTRKLAAAGRPETTCWDYLRARVLLPAGLDIEPGRMARDAKGQPRLDAGLHLTAREWARLGEFVRLGCSVEQVQADGTTRRVPVIAREALEACFVPSAANPAYGLTWWLLRDGATDSTLDGAGPEAAEGTRVPGAARRAGGALRDAEGAVIPAAMAAGAGGQRLYLVPSRGLVVVRLAALSARGRDYSDVAFLRLLLGVDAAQPPAPGPAPQPVPRPAPQPTPAPVADEAPPQAGAPAWVTPAASAPGLQQRLLQSLLVAAPVSYHVWTPPQYESEPTRRFPVLYWLHGSGGGLSGVPQLARALDEAVRSGALPPLVAVFPNGLPQGMWCDSHDRRQPVESVLVHELVPEVDRLFRTRAVRAERVLEGFSMGGYGAARLGFKFHDTFGAISMLAGGPLSPDFEVLPGKASTRADLLERVYGSLEAFRAASPWRLAEQHAGVLRGTPMRILVGSDDGSLRFSRDFHAHLDRLGLAHEYEEVPGVGHEPLALLRALGARFWAWHAAALARPAAPSGPRTPEAATGPAPQTPGPQAGLPVEVLELGDLVDRSRATAAGGRRVPVKACLPPPAGGPWPVVVVSHGAGGDWNSHHAQALDLAAHGYAVLCVEHVGSNRARLSGGGRLLQTVTAMTRDADEVLGRPRDVSFVLDTAAAWNASHPRLRGRLDLSRVGVMGHSFGAFTTLAACGMRPALDWLVPRVEPGRGLGPDLRDARVLCGVALSPQGPGEPFFLPESMAGLRVPVLGITGSKDSQQGGLGAENRRAGFALWPASGQHRLVWLANAGHLDFTDSSGTPGRALPSPTRADVQPVTRVATRAFFDLHLKGRADAASVLTVAGLRPHLRGAVDAVEVLVR